MNAANLLDDTPGRESPISTYRASHQPAQPTAKRAAWFAGPSAAITTFRTTGANNDDGITASHRLPGGSSHRNPRLGTQADPKDRYTSGAEYMQASDASACGRAHPGLLAGRESDSAQPGRLTSRSKKIGPESVVGSAPRRQPPRPRFAYKRPCHSTTRQKPAARARPAATRRLLVSLFPFSTAWR